MVFFIADTHFKHKNVLKFRTQFKSLEEHDETIIQNWNKVITKKKHIVWVLGDMFFANKDSYFGLVDILCRLNGTIRIISGNHDNIKFYPTDMLWNGIWKKYGYWLTHAPIHPDELRNAKNIHGHVHSKTIPDDRYINVSCENINYTPISLEQIRENNE